VKNSSIILDYGVENAKTANERKSEYWKTGLVRRLVNTIVDKYRSEEGLRCFGDEFSRYVYGWVGMLGGGRERVVARRSPMSDGERRRCRTKIADSFRFYPARVWGTHRVSAERTSPSDRPNTNRRRHRRRPVEGFANNKRISVLLLTAHGSESGGDPKRSADTDWRTPGRVERI